MERYFGRNYLLPAEAAEHLQVNEESVSFLLYKRRLRQAVAPQEVDTYRNDYRALYLAADNGGTPPLPGDSLPRIEAKHFEDLPPLPPFLYYFSEDSKQGAWRQGPKMGKEFSYTSPYQDFDGEKFVIAHRSLEGRFTSHQIPQELPAVLPIEELDRFRGKQQTSKKRDTRLKGEIYEEAILDALRILSLNPKNLPSEKRSGKCGVRSQVWKILEPQEIFWSKDAFDSAWRKFRARFA